MNTKKLIKDRSDFLFKQMVKQLPHNTSSVYLKVKLKNCDLYLPTNEISEENQKSKKNVYQSLVENAEY